jgi:hypothetical protein
MPGKTWTDDAEKDLLLAIIKALAGSGSDGKMRIPWDEVHAEMAARGHADTTKDAMR